jgi:hypothetical protein
MFLRYQISQDLSQDQTLITSDQATARQIDTNGHLEAIDLSFNPPHLYYVGDRHLKLWAPRLPVDDNCAPRYSAASTHDLKTIAHTCRIACLARNPLIIWCARRDCSALRASSSASLRTAAARRAAASNLAADGQVVELPWGLRPPGVRITMCSRRC